MERIYKVDRVINGKVITDYAVLSCAKTCNCPRALHDIGLEYCKTKGRDLYNREGGLSLPQLLRNTPSELFAKHGVTLTWLSEKVVSADQETKVVGKYELDTYYNTVNMYSDKFRRLYDSAKKIVYRLEKQRANNHPVISTWSAGKIAAKALMWSREFTGEKNYLHELDIFFQKKLDQVTADTAGGDRAEASVLANPMPG